MSFRRHRIVLRRGLLDYPLRKVTNSFVCQHQGNKYTKPEMWCFKLECGHEIVMETRYIKGTPWERKSFRCEECGKTHKD